MFTKSKKTPSRRTGASSVKSIDTLALFHAITVGVFITFIAQVSISAFALYAVGEALALPSIFPAAVPIGIDVPILVFTGAALIFKSRGRKFPRVFASSSVGVLTLASSGLNYLHALDTVDLTTRLGVAAVVVSALTPLLIWANVEILVSLVTKAVPTKEQQAVRRAAARTAAAKRQNKNSKPTRAAAQPAARKPTLEEELSVLAG